MLQREIHIPDGEIRGTPIVIEIMESMEITVHVGSEASVFVLCLQRASSPKALRIIQRGTVAAGGKLHWFNITRGADVQQDLVTECRGENASSCVDWIFVARGSSKQKISAKNIFLARSGAGEITMKGVAEQKAHTVCHGMIEIGEAGEGTNTYLTQDVLMLDPTAKIDAIPALEIRTNDVKASHSATVSRVTPEDLFYFQSRGIDQETARAMYVEGFLTNLTERITDPALCAKLKDFLLSPKY